MPKVTLSLPDDLLAAIDADAQLRRTSRSAVLRGYAEDALRRRTARRAAAIEQILRDVPPRPRGSRGVDALKQLRAER